MRLLRSIKRAPKPWRVEVTPMEGEVIMRRNLTTGVATINANMPQEVQDSAKARLIEEPLHS
jgi:hypothetical protein